MLFRILVFLLFSTIIYAQTNVSGSVSGTWASSGNPYYVTGPLTVANGNTLTIGPGVEIYFQVDTSFVIEGTLDVNGTSADSVLITVDSDSTLEFAGLRFNSNSSGSISYAKIEYGHADGVLPENSGGAIYFNGSSIIISNCDISNCSASSVGGAIEIASSSAIIENCKIHNNSGSYGGGIFTYTSDVVIRNNYIYSNSASNAGGGIHLVGNNDQPRVENNLIYNNSAVEGGGIGFNAGNEAVVINNTFYNNSATRNGGAVQVKFHDYGSHPRFFNNVIWNNTAASEGSQIFIEANANLDIDYCDIDGGEADIVNYGTLNFGNNNININPLFNDPGNADFTFEANSPLVDSSTNTGAPTIDFDGNTRPFDGDRDATATVDIGAYEYINTIPIISTTPVTSVDEDQPYNYDVDVDDPDAGETLTYSLVAGPHFLSINSATGEIAGLPDNDDVGNHPVTVVVTDLNGATDTQPFTLTVNQVNDAPVVSNIPDQTIDESGTFTAVALDNYVEDVDNPDAEITWSASSNVDLSVDINPVTRVAVITTPNANWNGSETITFTASDPDEDSDSDDATFQVTSINDPPVVTNIPDQTIDEGATFATITLDDYVSDVEHGDAEMTWTYSGNTDLTVDITARVATIGIPVENWNGSEMITFTATDPLGGNNSDAATFEVTSINDAPLVVDIPDQMINEGAIFATITLDDYVSDVDHMDAELTWGYSGNVELTVDITNRVATIGIPNEDWNGSETITFTATDPLEGTANDAATFEVISINDAPVVADIPDQSIEEGSSFTTINLDDYVSDADHTDDQMTWTYSGNIELTVDITDRVAIIGIPDENWIGIETITFTATDPEDSTDSDAASFEVNNINDPPVISDIDPQVFNEDESLSYTIAEIMENVHDPDHPDSLLFFMPYPGNNVTVSFVGDSLVMFSAPENWNGLDTLALIVSDGELADSALIYFEVKPVNDTPFFVGFPDTVEMYLMAEEEMYIGDFADDYDFDMPKDSLRWEVSVSDDTLKFDFDPVTKDLTLTAPDYADVFTVFITVTDDSGATADGSFYVNVTIDPSAIENLENGIPTSYVLKQNYPNPFNPTTHIKFGIPQAGDVLVEVYNLLGQKIVTLFDGYKSAGYHVVDFDASNLPTGIYFYRIKADKFQNVKKMMLVK